MFLALASLLVPWLQSQGGDIYDMDALVRSRFTQSRIPGGAFAVVRQGKLVHARGFGYADPANRVLFTPNTLCRIASISKCITGVAAMRLMQDGKLSLDSRVFDILALSDYCLNPAEADSRIKAIKVRDLLWQRSGLDSTRHLVWANKWTAKAVGAELPMKPNQLIQYALREKLLCSPGTDYHYANINFVLLSQIIDKITGSYSVFVNREVLNPCGIKDMVLCSAHLEDRQRNETLYFDISGREDESGFRGEDGIKRPGAYGGGGDYGASGDLWVASVTDLAKFLRGVFSSTKVLDSKMRKLLSSPYPNTPTVGGYCGAAFNIECRQTDNGPIYTFGHGGEMTGACGFIAGRFDDSFFIVLSNASNGAGKGELDQYPAMALIQPLHDMADTIYQWPTSDLFGGQG